MASKLADLALAVPGQAPDALPSSLGAIDAEYLRRAVPRRPTGGGGSYGPSWGSWRPPVSGRSCPCRCCAPPPAGWAGPTVPTGFATS